MAQDMAMSLPTSGINSSQNHNKNQLGVQPEISSGTSHALRIAVSPTIGNENTHAEHNMRGCTCTCMLFYSMCLVLYWYGFFIRKVKQYLIRSEDGYRQSQAAVGQFKVVPDLHSTEDFL